MAEPRDNFNTSIDELREIKKNYTDKTWEWYRDHTGWPRIVFRLAGVTVIVLSLTIPFLAAAKGEWLEIGVPIASLIIAILSSLNAFFAWQKTWEKRITIQLTLKGLMAAWETEITTARRSENLQEGYEIALRATQDIIENTRLLTVGETGAFFSSMKFPDVKAQKI